MAWGSIRPSGSVIHLVMGCPNLVQCTQCGGIWGQLEGLAGLGHQLFCILGVQVQGAEGAAGGAMGMHGLQQNRPASLTPYERDIEG